MVIANATDAQVANATDVTPSLDEVSKGDDKQLPVDQEFRKRRLRDLLEQHFDDNKTALGQFLGYENGTYIGQMLGKGTGRPIGEKMIERIETRGGGRFFGWFATHNAISEMALQIAKKFDSGVPDPLREATYAKIIGEIEFAADAYRRARSEPAPSPKPEPRPG